jgi:uncharacterized protein YndB with AHSA1/START domain
MTESTGAVIEGTLHSIDGEGVVRMQSRYETDIDDLWSALTDPERLARWYGTVEGELQVGGEFTAFISMSGWDGRGRIEECVSPHRLRVTMWEKEGPQTKVTAELVADGDHTTLAFEVRGVPLDLVWAYGAGWQIHVEHIAAHLAGQDGAGSDDRWDDLEPLYRAVTVVPLEG